ncbi:MAG: hypothetical protein JW984_11250 [Deltaproteobacteria bacterium]|uniref:Uncharacterized protein n=1 Tax=Candidatus Zymogenus saltonus TaxID=2844893 RepID=A0A9D8KH95_9DELT|nr:hypothetical protein [Candidatus Zymogenus saltonus]
MKGDLKGFLRKEVEIVAHGVVYRGVLIEVGEEEVLLKSEARWVTLLTLDVMEIREPGKHDKGLYKMIDKDFFKIDE